MYANNTTTFDELANYTVPISTTTPSNDDVTSQIFGIVAVVTGLALICACFWYFIGNSFLFSDQPRRSSGRFDRLKKKLPKRLRSHSRSNHIHDRTRGKPDSQTRSSTTHNSFRTGSRTVNSFNASSAAASTLNGNNDGGHHSNGFVNYNDKFIIPSTNNGTMVIHYVQYQQYVSQYESFEFQNDREDSRNINRMVNGHGNNDHDGIYSYRSKQAMFDNNNIEMNGKNDKNDKNNKYNNNNYSYNELGVNSRSPSPSSNSKNNNNSDMNVSNGSININTNNNSNNNGSNSNTSHIIGPWCIEDDKKSIIGKGAFSIVYKAYDRTIAKHNKNRNTTNIDDNIDSNATEETNKNKNKSKNKKRKNKNKEKDKEKESKNNDDNIDNDDNEIIHSDIFVAIKIIDNQDSNEKKLKERRWMTSNEIDCLSRISHNNVIQMLAYDKNGKFNSKNVILFVLEYAPNGDLSHLIRKLGGLSNILARTYFRQILKGVEACHSASVIHRDLKTDNIVLDCNYNAKICDFGLAKVK